MGNRVFQLHMLKINENFTIPLSAAIPILLDIRMEMGKSAVALIFHRPTSPKHLYLLCLCHVCTPRWKMGKKYVMN